MTMQKKWKSTLLVMIAFFSSCTINEIHEEYVNCLTMNYTVYKKDWKVEADAVSGDYYYYTFKEKDLTPYIFDRGIMQAFLLMPDDNLTPLPFNDYWVDIDGYMWTEQVTCEFKPGYVTFIVKSSDHLLIPPHFDFYDFNVRLMW
jgi:hypothetical protein